MYEKDDVANVISWAGVKPAPTKWEFRNQVGRVTTSYKQGCLQNGTISKLVARGMKLLVGVGFTPTQ